ncbi:hypothetical protein OY671_009157, partial [Metschnikowia pulcherrima]
GRHPDADGAERNNRSHPGRSTRRDRGEREPDTERGERHQGPGRHGQRREGPGAQRGQCHRHRHCHHHRSKRIENQAGPHDHHQPIHQHHQHWLQPACGRQPRAQERGIDHDHREQRERRGRCRYRGRRGGNHCRGHRHEQFEDDREIQRRLPEADHHHHRRHRNERGIERHHRRFSLRQVGRRHEHHRRQPDQGRRRCRCRYLGQQPQHPCGQRQDHHDGRFEK